MNYKAALFDLDGVVLDTEGQYTQFWGQIGREFHPEQPDFGNLIKGQTLVQIYDAWFAGQTELQATITARLDAYEAEMTYPYIAGVSDYLQQLHSRNIPTAIVTSSNKPKMENVYKAHPELKTLFTKILTSEDFHASKPDPDCYLCAAKALGVDIKECVVFEDSINGLRSGRASGAHVIGLITTNPVETIAPLCDMTIRDFTELRIEE